MIDRLKTIGHGMINSDKKVDQRIYELGILTTEANELFMEAYKGNYAKYKELAEKCVEIGLVADSIACEMYLSQQVELEDLNKAISEKIKEL